MSMRLKIIPQLELWVFLHVSEEIQEFQCLNRNKCINTNNKLLFLNLFRLIAKKKKIFNRLLMVLFSKVNLTLQWVSVSVSFGIGVVLTVLGAICCWLPL